MSHKTALFAKHMGPAVQNTLSLTSSFRGHLIKCLTILWPNTLIFLLKNERSFCNAKVSHIFFNNNKNKKKHKKKKQNTGLFEILMFEILTNR